MTSRYCAIIKTVFLRKTSFRSKRASVLSFFFCKKLNLDGVRDSSPLGKNCISYIVRDISSNAQRFINMLVKDYSSIYCVDKRLTFFWN